MRGIVKLEYDSFFNDLKIMKSISLIDKKEFYEAKFKSTTGYIMTESFIRKTDIGIPKGVWFSTLGTVIMYVNRTLYDKCPLYYQNIIKSYNKQVLK